MAWQENLSEDVREVSLYRPLPVYLHGYLIPFLLVYAAVLLGWSQVYGLTEHWEALLISLAAVAVLNVLVVLSCVWSVHFRAFLTYKKVRERTEPVNMHNSATLPTILPRFTHWAKLKW